MPFPSEVDRWWRQSGRMRIVYDNERLRIDGEGDRAGAARIRDSRPGYGRVFGGTVTRQVYTLDPLRDTRWSRLLEKHPDASVFHSRGWLNALDRTYAYQPIVYTTSAPGMELTNGLVFCLIDSWLTGPRLVSLPFSDHCEPLVDSDETLRSLLGYLTQRFGSAGCKYIELRPLRSSLDPTPGFGKSAAFHFHRLDLRPAAEVLFRSFHKSNVRARIRRAEREHLTYEAGRSESLLRMFYRLLLLTCRHRRLPPQPINWFRHLIDCMGDAVQFHVASKDGQPVASILTLTFKQTLVYKYGCSDRRLNNLGGTQFLFWKALQKAKEDGLQEFDLGRSDLQTPGLVTFKDRWGSARSMINYFRCPAPARQSGVTQWSASMAQSLFARMPDRLLVAAGRMLYRHVG